MNSQNGSSEQQEGMTFAGALEALKFSKRIARRGWNGKNQFIELQRPDEGSMNTEPYIFFVVRPNTPEDKAMRIPWVASQTDLLASDWEEVE